MVLKVWVLLCLSHMMYTAVHGFTLQLDTEDELIMGAPEDCPCPPKTATVMKAYRQCQLRLEQKSSQQRSSDQKLLETKMQQASSECITGDQCYSHGQAVWMNTACFRELNGALDDTQLEDIDAFSQRFPLTISYSVWPDYPDSEKQMIHAAFADYTAKTCLLFYEVGYYISSLIRVNTGSGCSSNVGRVVSTGQVITLKSDSLCFTKGTILHEIGHAMGMIHEQSRSDRDNYIIIEYDNIKPGINHNNFDKAFNVILNGPYDYSSMMQYGRTAGAVDGTNTLVPIDQSYLNTLGQRAGFAFYDLYSVNSRYCKRTCSGSTLTCLHLGYLDPTTCDRCHCQAFFSGVRCESLRPHSNNAICPFSQVIGLGSDSEHTITMTNYDNADLTCLWKIQTHPGYHLVVNAVAGTPYLIGQSHICKAHWLEFRDETNEDVLGARFCGVAYPSNMKSKSNVLLVMFSVTNYAAFSLSQFPGFSILFKAEKDPLKCAVPTLTIANTDNTIGKTLVWVLGQSITYTCKAGYYVSEGQDNFTRQCINENSVAAWSITTTACVDVLCATLPTIANSNEVQPPANSFKYGETITITCLDGFVTPNGQKTFISTCSESTKHTGSWTGVLTCLVGTTCVSRPSIANSDGGSPVLSVYTLGQTITYKCNMGYVATGQTTDSFTGTCTKGGNVGQWTGLVGCSDLDECSSTTSACANGSPCQNTIGSYYCPCIDNKEPTKMVPFSVVLVEPYPSLYGNWHAASQLAFRTSAQTVLLNIYNSGTNKATEAVFACNIRAGSTVVEHLALTTNTLSDADKAIYALEASKLLKSSTGSSGTLIINKTTVTLSQDLGITTATGIFIITSSCSYFNAVGTCTNNMVCSESAGTPQCICPSGTSCTNTNDNTKYYIIGGAIGSVILIVIIIAVCAVCCQSGNKKQEHAHPQAQKNTAYIVKNQNAYIQQPQQQLVQPQEMVQPQQLQPRYYNLPPQQGYTQGGLYLPPSNYQNVMYPSPQRMDASAYYTNYQTRNILI